jgi:hypothetical protein
VSGEAVASGVCAILTVVVLLVRPAIRPDDVLAGLRQNRRSRTHRTRCGDAARARRWHSEFGIVGDPLAPDRDGSND